MALIICPHCGQKISDTVEKCVHCGKLVKESVEEEKKEVSFNGLTIDEKTAIKKEFYNRYPKYQINSKKDSKQFNKLRYLRTFFSIIELLGYVFATIFDINSNEILGKIGIIFIILGIVGFIVMTVFIRKMTKINLRKKMLCEKKFWKWITTEKQMAYNVCFSSPKERDVYDSINIEYEDL